MKKLIVSLFCVALLSSQLYSISIEEKITKLRETPPELSEELKADLEKINKELRVKNDELNKLYEQVSKLYKIKVAEPKYRELLDRVNVLKIEIREVEDGWEAKVGKEIASGAYGIWHRPHTNLQDLTIDYGSLSYLYNIPEDVAKMKVSVASDLPLPRGSWESTLEQIFMANGVGVRDVNPFLKTLYILDKDPSGLYIITNKRRDLEAAPPEKRICFVEKIEYASARELVQSLQGFINPKDTYLQAIDEQLFIVAKAEKIKEIMRVYDFIKQARRDKVIKIIKLTKVEANDMAEFLNTQLFTSSATSTLKGVGTTRATPRGAGVAGSLKIATFPNLAHSLFLNGSKEEVEKVEDLVLDIESQITDSQLEVINVYHCKNSTAEELAKSLRSVYAAILNKSFFGVTPAASRLRASSRKTIKAADVEGNFIVDEKTNALIMIVEERSTEELYDILKKLDKPKKMVKIDILLFEKSINDGSEFGLNVLNLGSAAASSNTLRGLVFKGESNKNKAPTIGEGSNKKYVKNKKGIVEAVDLNPFGMLASGLSSGVSRFFLSNKRKGSFPAFDIGYSFLMSQTDAKIISNPSITTINQTEAKIEVKTEQSVDKGSVVNVATGATERSFDREKYGIDIAITPTVHIGDSLVELEESGDFITLKTKIGFDTVKASSPVVDRPEVDRRVIDNEVTIADGQTVIIGGLRRSQSDLVSSKIPFLGEIPGLGKLFSYTGYADTSKEMFVCITPRIIHDPTRDFEKMKQEEFRRRPGDLPEFIRLLEEARKVEKRRLFVQGFRALFGKPSRSAMGAGEYDGI